VEKLPDLQYLWRLIRSSDPDNHVPSSEVTTVAAQKFTKQELKQDSFLSTTERVLEYGQKNATTIGIVLVAIVVLLVGGSYVKSSRESAQREASAMLYQGQMLLAEGQATAAMGPLQDVIDEHGGTQFGTVARVSLVQALLQMGDPEGALARIAQYRDEVSADHPAAAELAVLEANALADAGRFGEAADALGATISDDLIDSVRYHRQTTRSDWLIAAGRVDAAIAILEDLDVAIKSGTMMSFGNDLENRLGVARALRS
jgi:predicted negative regulator of RcsB-dependent stress response